MPPKKREKESESAKHQRTEAVKTDHDLFLQAFEKPTQIYRYLRVRNATSPIFLQRNLSYMRFRMSRSHKSRQGFKVDSLLEKVSKSLVPEALRGGFMTLTFLGFYDKKDNSKAEVREPVKVETLLLKICHKKRKDTTSPVMTVTVGTSYVPINPSEDFPPPKAPVVSVSADEFSLDQNEVKSFHLLLRVYVTSSGFTSANNSDQETGEPLQKRRKASVSCDDVKLFGTDLVIYDKMKRCFLGDGDYELLLDEMQQTRNVPKKFPSWEPIGDINEDCNSFELFANGPTLKFKLEWSREQRSSFVDRPRSAPVNEEEILDSNCNKENRPERSAKKQANDKKDDKDKDEKKVPLAVKKPIIIYQFHYNNNSRQQTEPCRDLHCPWCSLDCGSLFSLLKHLKLCHARFTFTYTPLPNLARIDVAINESYDGSYTGSPHDVIAQPGGSAFSRHGPQIRSTVSHILVCHPKRPKPSLSEFMELEEESGDLQRSFITGHNRLYHHTVTCLPVHPKEMDNDSESENDPKWLQTKTMMMIDEFTDVNEGEKELMKMWNLHVMKEGYVGDCQIPLACRMFLEKRGKELLEKNLYRNFIVHMCSLFDYGLVSPLVLYQTVQHLHEMVTESHAKIMQGAWVAQREHWIKSGAKERQNTPSHFKNPQTSSGNVDPNTRRKLYSPGSYQSESPNRRKTQQAEDHDEDEDDDEEEKKVNTKINSCSIAVMSEVNIAKRKSAGQSFEPPKKKNVAVKSGHGPSTSHAPPKSQLVIEPSGSGSKPLGCTGNDSLKRKVNMTGPSAVPGNSKQTSSACGTISNKHSGSAPAQGVSKSASACNEPPTKKKLVVSNTVGKPQAVISQNMSNNQEVKRKLSVGASGSNLNVGNGSDSKKPQVNGLPQSTGKTEKSSQMGCEVKKRLSLQGPSVNLLKTSNNGITPTSNNILDIKKRSLANGLCTPADGKLVSNCTVDVVQFKECIPSTSNGKTSLSVNSDAKRKSSLGQNPGGASTNQTDNGPQRRKSLCVDTSSTSEGTAPVLLRRKSFSSNQSSDSNPIQTLPSKGVTS